MSYYRNSNQGGYYGRQRDPLEFAFPRGGLNEDVYCGIKARYGYWPKTFLDVVEKFAGGKIPERFERIAARLAIEKPWELPEDKTAGLPPTITVVNKSGEIIDRWRPSQKDWDDAATAPRTSKDE